MMGSYLPGPDDVGEWVPVSHNLIMKHSGFRSPTTWSRRKVGSDLPQSDHGT
ncbi:hypothetical protein DPMN_133034 [Dreissena polymorpha]|uniref:Uncharacterized protein n=1 Tax=Dreissena polymorpha TaxID=45954 RepID=A0A9D4FTI1_DREPO|nr:hypothetical protein DPMN_133034 [Dreissena polymorpha]